MSIAILNKSVPCIVADMIRDAIVFYKQRGKVVDCVYLPPMRFEIFKAWLQRQDEEKGSQIVDEVHFKDIKVKKSKFQVDPIKVTFKKTNGQVQLQ